MAHSEDLRHMTSATHLSSQRSPRQPRLGSRSPNSIPSSPTSVHSSSSAIFERDIEPAVPPSPPFLSNPHRIPRAKGTEQLEHAVPSVLDSAASLLAGIDETPESTALDHIAVVAPAAPSSPPAFDSILARSPSSGFTSPIGSFRSRSPSPLGLRVGSIPLLNIPAPFHNPPNLAITPAAESSTSSAPSQSGTTTTAAGSSTYTHHHQISHPPSPTHGPTKRLSFMSYSDLLSSTPVSTLPLSSLTTSCSSMDPPPHIPSVNSLALNTPAGTKHPATSSAATSLRGFAIAAAGTGNRDSTAMSLDDVGGEWEREGLGKGLEERLEALINLPPVQPQVVMRG